MASNLSDVLTGELCSGCGACAALAPDALRLELSHDGFLRPEVLRPLGAQEQAEIEAVCPGIGQTLRAKDRAVDPVWGPLFSITRGHATDPELRHQGASGGALSGFLVSLLAAGRVDGVVHIGADPARPLRNITRVSHTRDEVLAGAGSRYAPSSPLDCVTGLLDSGKTYAFVGKPCDVSALAAWREQNPTVARCFPILVSFLCAGVPSLHGAACVTEAMGVPGEDLAKFAYRGPGWPGSATATSMQGTTRNMSYAKSWGAILSKHVQHRCKVCADGAGAFADVVFGDAWEADPDGYPSFDDRPGQSAILVRTALGTELMAAAEASDALETTPLGVSTLTAMQPGQVRRRRVVSARLAGLWLTGRAVPKYRGFGLERMAFKAGPIEVSRNFLGMMRRAFAIPRKGKRIC